MKDERKEIKEPYTPKETPRPPQNVHPTGKQNNPAAEKEGDRKDAPDKNKDRSGNGHMLTDDAHIDDETTI